MTSCFVFMIFLIYVTCKFLLLGNTRVLISLMTLLSASPLIFFIFGFAFMGQLMENEVRQWKLKSASSAVKLTFNSQAGKTGILIHKILNYEDDEHMKKTLMNFSQQLLHRLPKITCGLFSFDSKLTFSMISTAAIYLIILIQFDTQVKHETLIGANKTCWSILVVDTIIKLLSWFSVVQMK